MKYIFSEEGLKILESYCFAQTLFGFDYDGTLTRIVKDPSQAKLPTKTTTLLRALNNRVPFAIISGRSKKDLQSLLDFAPRYLIGNHGQEGLKVSTENQKAVKSVCDGWYERLQQKIASEPGVVIEHKEYSLAVHYRLSRSRSFAKLLILESCGLLSPAPRLIMGKCVVNLIPSGAPHKGMALLELMLECNVKNAFYIGDDDTDEDVFTLPNPRLLSVRVGKKKESSALFYIREQNQINLVLTQILDYLRGG